MIIRALLCVFLFWHPVRSQTDDAILDSLQSSAFRFFWYEANPSNGLMKDRSAPGAACSIASVGFGLSAICIAADHGWVSREAARDRVRTTLETFWNGPQGSAASGTIGYKGFFYHFLDMTTAKRALNSELSTIDSGLLFAGILDAREYFSTADSLDGVVRALADSIYRRADWNWFRNFNPGILMGWNPGTQFAGYGEWVGYNEAMIMYILALGSPTHPVPTSAWSRWTGGYLWQSNYGYTYVTFPPLFGHQYSHCWIDFRNIADAYMRAKGITYFENSRRATLAQRAYSIANPGGFAGYSDSLWGITASDAPTGYSARGAPPPQNDDGTIAPTAPGGSLPFAPEQSLAVLRNLYTNYHAQLWTKYGFRDAFNLTVNWYDTDIIGIDQGPITIMAENYRTQSVWTRFMKNPFIQVGLQRAGFDSVSTSAADPSVLPGEYALFQNYPNPFNPATTIAFDLPRSAFVRLSVYDLLGRQVATLADGVMGAGTHAVDFIAGGLPSGTYFYRLVTPEATRVRKLLLTK